MCFDGDPSEVWIERRRKARKRWNCVECGAPIPIGAHYIETSALTDGHWTRASSHVECDALWDFVWGELCNHDGLKMLGGLSEEIGEYSEPERDAEGWIIPDQVTLRDVFEAIREGYSRQGAVA